MASTFDVLNANNVTVANAPAAPTDAVRKAELDVLSASFSGVAHAPVTVADTASVALGLAGQALTAQVRRKTSGFTPGQGEVDETADGLVARLGNSIYTAAPGSHGHDDATGANAGFMSAADKAKLNGIAAGATATALGGTGIADTAARSDHTHLDVTSGASGFMSPLMLQVLGAAVTEDEAAEVARDAVGALIASTASIEADYTDSGSGVGALSLAVRRQTASLSVIQGVIDETVDGLVVRLGNSAYTAAPGNHGHTEATQSAPGFMSAADKKALDALTVEDAWLPSVDTFASLPVNTDGVGAARLVRDEGRIYRCVAQVGFRSDQWKLVFVPWESSVPAASNSSGVRNSVAYDSAFLYVCIAANTWRRATLSSF